MTHFFLDLLDLRVFIEFREALRNPVARGSGGAAFSLCLTFLHLPIRSSLLELGESFSALVKPDTMPGDLLISPYDDVDI
jgi:hypothetical protein